MHAGIADHEKIREVMNRFGEIMEDQGYRKVLEDIEGDGQIGRAVKNPRSTQALRVIDLFLKDIAKELRKEPPSQERANALAATKAAFAEVKRNVQ